MWIWVVMFTGFYTTSSMRKMFLCGVVKQFCHPWKCHRIGSGVTDGLFPVFGYRLFTTDSTTKLLMEDPFDSRHEIFFLYQKILQKANTRFFIFDSFFNSWISDMKVKRNRFTFTIHSLVNFTVAEISIVYDEQRGWKQLGLLHTDVMPMTQHQRQFPEMLSGHPSHLQQNHQMNVFRCSDRFINLFYHCMRLWFPEELYKVFPVIQFPQLLFHHATLNKSDLEVWTLLTSGVGQLDQ